MPRENESVPAAPEEKRDVMPEKREKSSLDAEDALGDRLVDIGSDVEKSGPSESTLDVLESAAADVMPVPDEMKKEASAIDTAITSLKAKMKNGLESLKETLKGRRTFEYEYSDAQGRTMCKVKAEMSTSKQRVVWDTADGREGRARILRSLLLEGEKDGRPVSVDLLRLANRHGVEVLVGTERLENSGYDDDEQKAIVSSLETPFDLATLLHELGHADQWKDPRFVAKGLVYLREPNVTKEKPTVADFSAAEIEKLVEDVAFAVPEVEQVIDWRVLAKLKEVDAKMSENPENVDELYAEKKTLMEELRFEDLVLLPKRMKERDATRRAFVWLRELRKQGIDLLGQLPTPKHATSTEHKESSEGCEQAVETGLSAGETLADQTAEKTIREELDRSLETYKAKKRTRFQKPGSAGPGIRPSAGSKRKIK